MANMNNQGKRKDQYENSAKFAWYAIVGMVTLLVLTTLLSGCVTTKKAEHPKVLKETQLNDTVDKCCSTPKTSTK
jgi:hypothetical protein